MKALMRSLALLLCVCIILPAFSSCNSDGLFGVGEDKDGADSLSEVQNTVKVMVTDGEHYRITSANPVGVYRGGSVSFAVEVDEGYEIAEVSEGAVYAGGFIVVTDVKAPVTVEARADKKAPVIEIPDPEPLPELTELSAPKVSVSEDGVASWDEVENASAYVFRIDGGDEIAVTVTSVQLKDGQSITVKAVGDGLIYADGEYSERISYTASTQPEPPLEPEFDTVILSAEEKSGYRFICWTLDTPAEEGGTVLSEKKSGTFEIPHGAETVANYVEEGYYVILYRTNGGTTKDGKEFYYQTFSNENFYMPNTIHQDGTFVREGHVLMRYTENADGTGEYTTLGGKIECNENGFRELYLKWGKATTSGIGYSVFAKGEGEYAAAVTGYRGYNKEVVIPETISMTVDGEEMLLRVECIKSGAFTGKSLSRLVLPSTIQTVEDGAFSDCKKLSELTIHDNVWQISDASFSGCTELKTIYLNAGRLPTHAGSTEADFCLKYEKIRRAYREGKKKIIVYSGSSSLYGFRAKDMEAAFEGEYSVINYGTNAGVSVHFYIESQMRFYTAGDIIIMAPETTSGTQLGDTNITWRNFRGTEVMFETFSYVDMRGYTDFFDSLCEFNQTVRNTMDGRSYERCGGSIDEYTDLATNKDNFNYSNTQSTNPFNANNMNPTRANRLNTLYAGIKAKGAHMYMSWAPVCRSYCNSTAMDPDTQDLFMEKFDEYLDFTIISDVADYILDDKYFNNSNYHPGIEGSKIRTERLIADLVAQMIIDGLLAE